MMANDGERPRVALIVDDDAVVRTAMQRFVARLGFAVRSADNGRAALALFEARGADIVLLDAAMPVLDGFAACAAIRALPGGRHVPIVMITGFEDEDSVDRAFESGATDYVAKPIHWAVLRNRVRQLVEAADAERRLRHDRAFFQSLVDAIPDPTVVCDRQGAVRWMNQGVRHFPLLAEAALDLPLRLAAGASEPDCEGSDPQAIVERIRARAAAADAPVDLLLHRTDPAGGELYAEVHARALRGAEGASVGLILRLRDVTARELESRRLRSQASRYGELAYRDSLTGLANRLLLEERLSQAIGEAERSGERLALLFLDLDGFKAINDARGHAAGDRVLCEVAARLRGEVRRPDTVARLGGDEFAVLLRNMSERSAVIDLGERLLAAIRKAIDLPDGRVGVGASIGIGLFPEHGATGTALLRRADEAMYAVKSRGKCGVEVAPPVGPD